MQLKKIAYLVICVFLFYFTGIYIYYRFFYKVIVFEPEDIIFKIKPSANSREFSLADLAPEELHQRMNSSSSSEEPLLRSGNNIDRIDEIIFFLDDNSGFSTANNLRETIKDLYIAKKTRRHIFRDRGKNSGYLVEIGYFDNLEKLKNFETYIKQNYAKYLNKLSLDFIIEKQELSRNFFTLNIGYYSSLKQAKQFCDLLANIDVEGLIKKN